MLEIKNPTATLEMLVASAWHAARRGWYNIYQETKCEKEARHNAKIHLSQKATSYFNTKENNCPFLTFGPPPKV
jgi:hypothetical protein